MKKNIALITLINWIFLSIMLLIFLGWNIWAISTDNSVWLYDHPRIFIPIGIVVLISAFAGPILNGLCRIEFLKLKFELDLIKALNKVLKK